MLIMFISRSETPGPVEAVSISLELRCKSHSFVCPQTYTLWNTWALGQRRHSRRRLTLEQADANSHHILSCGSHELKSSLLPVCRMRIDVCIFRLLVHLGPTEECQDCIRKLSIPGPRTAGHRRDWAMTDKPPGIQLDFLCPIYSFSL